MTLPSIPATSLSMQLNFSSFMVHLKFFRIQYSYRVLTKRWVFTQMFRWISTLMLPSIWRQESKQSRTTVGGKPDCIQSFLVSRDRSDLTVRSPWSKWLQQPEQSMGKGWWHLHVGPLTRQKARCYSRNKGLAWVKESSDCNFPLAAWMHVQLWMCEQVYGSKAARSPPWSVIHAGALWDLCSCLDFWTPARSGHLVWTIREIEAVHKAGVQISTPFAVFGDHCGGLVLIKVEGKERRV